MALLPEYIIVCIYIHILGLRIKSGKEMKLLLSQSRAANSYEMGRHSRH